MRRKIIKQGMGGATVFLPIGWVRSNKLSPGDEVNIEEREGGLFLSTEVGKKESALEMDITGMTVKSIQQALISSYTAGYTEVRILYKTKSAAHTKHAYIKKESPASKAKEEIPVVDVIYNTVRDLIGYEVVEQKEHSLKIKQISKVDEEEFNVTLRRVHLLAQEMASSLLESAKENRFNPSDLYLKTENLRRFTNYGIRILKNRSVSKNYFDYALILDRFDNIAHAYHFVARFMSGIHTKKEAGTIEVLSGLCKIITSIQDIQYNFSFSKYDQVDKDIRSIYHIINKNYENSGRADVRIRQILSAALADLTSIANCILTINIEKTK